MPDQTFGDAFQHLVDEFRSRHLTVCREYNDPIKAYLERIERDIAKKLCREFIDLPSVEELPPYIKYGSVWKKTKVAKQCIDHVTGEDVEVMRTSTVLSPLCKDILHNDEALHALLFD